MKLYKYVSPERINVLENSLIRFTQPSELNDPFDIQPGPLEDIVPENTWSNVSTASDSSIEDGSLAKEAAVMKVQEAFEQSGLNKKNLPKSQRRAIEQKKRDL